ncbi:hypothetical protein WJX84_008243 [Apatococcus fuscideae]|uniref:Arsenite methyltransferase n=1 Tax=Apatococcus fuscideae TaxID=2026836 RepID=A0AAW1TBU9_9CHLO
MPFNEMSVAAYKNVEEYYGKVLQTSKSLKTSACTAASRPPEHVLKVLGRIPEEVSEKFYGCGAPLPAGIQGLHILDLGSGSGRDCYAAAAMVGEAGRVTGLDMTVEQLQVAERHAEEYCTQQLGYARVNMAFVKGHIEFLDRAGLEDSTVDMIISNCVINLSPDKYRVLSEAYRVLRSGGEMYFSDVYCDRRVPDAAQQNEVLWGECISGALYRGNAHFYSSTYRLFKLPGLLEPAHENYGQKATYMGTVPGSAHDFVLDENHRFETGKPALVCGNTAAMLGEGGMSWLSKHFQVSAARSVHLGAFGHRPIPSANPAPPQQNKPIAKDAGRDCSCATSDSQC